MDSMEFLIVFGETLRHFAWSIILEITLIDHVFCRKKKYYLFLGVEHYRHEELVNISYLFDNASLFLNFYVGYRLQERDLTLGLCIMYGGLKFSQVNWRTVKSSHYWTQIYMLGKHVSKELVQFSIFIISKVLTPTDTIPNPVNCFSWKLYDIWENLKLLLLELISCIRLMMNIVAVHYFVHVFFDHHLLFGQYRQ